MWFTHSPVKGRYVYDETKHHSAPPSPMPPLKRVMTVPERLQASMEAHAGKVFLWRGLKDSYANDEFLQRGGTEVCGVHQAPDASIACMGVLATQTLLPPPRCPWQCAPMSTTNNLSVALEYCASAHPVIMRLHTESFMQRGAELAFLSCFP